jgi:hypothetical protein
LLLAGFLTQQQKFDLALFVAIQAMRGWQFREELNQAGTLHMRSEMSARRDELAPSARRHLRKRGKPSNPEDVDRFLDEVYGDNGPRLVMNDAVRVQISLRQALLTITPMLLQRDLRIYRFDRPSLIISDAPVGAWAPGHGRAVGIGNAKLVYLPLSRTLALAYGAKIANPLQVGGRIRAQQINTLVADGAYRWIYEHPDDSFIATLGIPPDRPKWVTEFVVRPPLALLHCAASGQDAHA